AGPAWPALSSQGRGDATTEPSHRLGVQELLENTRGHLLRMRTRVSFRPDTRWAAGFARASRNQIARALEQEPMPFVQRSPESNTAWIVVVDEHVWLGRQRLRNAAHTSRPRRLFERSAIH